MFSLDVLCQIPVLCQKEVQNQIFFCSIYVFAVDAAAVNPNSIKTFLAKGLSNFFINGKTDFSNGATITTRCFPICTISGK